jgi:hypothetical protein
MYTLRCFEGDLMMDMYAIHLGRAGIDGFKSIEVQKALGSSLEEMQQRGRDLLRTRGAQLGANRVQILAGADSKVWE